jgi:hypothetical protein
VVALGGEGSWVDLGVGMVSFGAGMPWIEEEEGCGGGGREGSRRGEGGRRTRATLSSSRSMSVATSEDDMAARGKGRTGGNPGALLRARGCARGESQGDGIQGRPLGSLS